MGLLDIKNDNQKLLLFPPVTGFACMLVTDD